MRSLTRLFLSSLLSLTPIFSLTSLAQEPVEIRVVNLSQEPFCIEDQLQKQCFDQPSFSVQIFPQYFYERSGVIRISLGDHPGKIAMIKKGIHSTSLNINPEGNIKAEPNTFEKGSFIYANNKDYLYFAAKPFGLFSQYPM